MGQRGQFKTDGVPLTSRSWISVGSGGLRSGHTASGMAWRAARWRCAGFITGRTSTRNEAVAARDHSQAVGSASHLSKARSRR